MNVRLTQFKLAGPSSAEIPSNQRLELSSPTLASPPQRPTGLHTLPLLDPTVRNDRFEPNMVFYSPPRVDELGNVYSARSRPDVPGSWGQLTSKHLYKGYAHFEDLYGPYTQSTQRDPSEYLNDPANKPVPVKTWKSHDVASPRFAKVLSKVELSLMGDHKGLAGTVWQPRRVKNTDHLSLHALGDAIDIDTDNNPHIVSKPDLEAVKEITSRDLGHPMSRSELRTASAVFQEKFAATRDSLKDRLAIIRQLAEVDRTSSKALKPERNRIERLLQTMKQSKFETWQQKGFFNLPNEIIDAFLTADPNVVWGGEYPHSKDFMHFEFNPRLRKQIDKQR